MADIDDTLLERLDLYIRDHGETPFSFETSSPFEPMISAIDSTADGIMGEGAVLHSFLLRPDRFESVAKRRAFRKKKEIAPDVSEFINAQKNKETFSVLLDRLRQERNQSPADLYKAADIDRKLYSKIMGKRDYQPSKNTVIAFGLALKLPDNEMDQLLDSAGFTLSKSVITDLIIAFCLENMIYEIPDVNALLVAKNQPVLR
jgi:hypothetical protein